MRSSMRARRRWRSSRVATLGSGWSVMNTWKRCPSASVKLSWAPGWGSSRRQIARVPCGQPARLRVCSSATSAPGRGWPPASTAGCQASAATAKTAARTRSLAGRLTENRTPRWRRRSTRAWWRRRCRRGPAAAGRGRPWGAARAPGRPPRCGRWRCWSRRCPAAGFQPGPRRCHRRGLGRRPAGRSRSRPCRSQLRLACRSGRPAACRPHPPPAGPRPAPPPARPPLWRGHAQRAGRQARWDHKRPAQPPATPSAWRQPGRTARAGCAGRQDRSSSRRRRSAAPPDLVGPSPRHGGAGWSGCGPPASPTRGSTRAGQLAPSAAPPRHVRRSRRHRR
jgi:hypothetical protein